MNNRSDTLTRAKSKKFLFDINNFDEPEKEGDAAEVPPPPVFSEAELDQAKNEAHAKGKRDGYADSQASIEKQISDTLANIRDNMRMLFEEEERRARVFEKEAVQLAVTIFARSFPALNARFGLEEVQSAISSILETVRELPEIIVETGFHDADTIQKHIDTVLKTEGGPKCTVRGTDSLGAGQCRLIWNCGSAMRDGPRLAEEIQHKIEQVLADKAILTDNQKVEIHGSDDNPPDPATDGDPHE